MEQLKQEIEQALFLIETIEEGLLSKIPEVMQERLPLILTKLLKIFPAIVTAYKLEELQQYQEEIPYWSEQMERLINASQGDDLFYFYDVLIQETRASIVEFQQRIE